MKQGLNFKRFFASLMLLAVSTLSWAYDFEVNGIYYNFTGGNTVEVTNNGNNSYSGTVVIPSSVEYFGVTSIGESAFNGCSGLTSITIPNSVTSIGDDAFHNCSGLMSITIPESVRSIGDGAFDGCSGLTSITIPESVTSIGNYAFKGCSGLKSITVASGNTKYESSTNCNAIIEKATNTLITGCKNTVIPKRVTSIGKSAFSNCSGLKSITIPNSVTSIADEAFSGCSGLTSVTIPNSVTRIANEAFLGCSGLTSVTINSNAILSENYALNMSLKTIFGEQVKEYNIGNGVTSIGYRAFEGCSGLTSITIPNSVTYISFNAFEGCSSLSSVTINSNAILSKSYSSFNIDDIFGSQVKEYIIGNGVTSIGSNAFRNCSSLTSVTIPNSVTSIGEWAFIGCSGLTSITIPNSVTSIGDEAFGYCSGLMSITIPNSVRSIGNYAFEGCSGLILITIPNSVTTIGEYVFSGCSSLTSVALNSNTIVSKDYTNSGNLGTIFGSQVTNCVIGNDVTSIGEWAFYSCSGLTSITIPESVTSIGRSAFKDCSGLTSIICKSATAPNIRYITFDGVDKTIPVYVPEASVASYKAAPYWSEFTNILGGNGPEHIYIETNLTSQFPTDWEGWNGATGYVGWAAPQVTTNDGRQTPACERYDGSQATTGVIFNRTLTGLTNGTYRIELYGAAASTKSRDTGIDTEMTAYDEGYETAVYLYATTPSGTMKQYIPVHWALDFNTSGIATATLNKVEVTDGTVEIGMYSDKKFTNWEVVQIKGVTALVDVVELHTNTLQRAQSAIADEAYVNVTGVERTALQQAIANNTTVSEHTAEAYQAAITALEDATKAFTDAKESYDTWADIAKRSYLYASVDKKSAAESAASVLPTSASGALSKAESLKPLFRRYAESSALMEGIEAAVDVTATYIRNPKAEEAIDANVWQMIFGQGSGGYINIYTDQPWTDASGSTNHRYFDGRQYYKSAWDVTLKQDITLPAGRYQLTAVGRSSADVALTLFAGEATAEMAHIGATGGLFNNGWEQTSVEFELTEEATVSIGARGVTNVINNWMSFSDFRLVQFPETQVLDTSIALNKTEATLEIGAQEQLTATVLPETAVQAVAWATSDPAVATVDENGLVTAVAVGAVIITATTTDGTDLIASCKVTVEDPAIPGDVNGDGNVNGADVVAVINYVLADDIAGDVNGDGNVNGADIVAVINYVLNYSGNNVRQTLAQSRAAVAEEPAEILSGTKTEEGISLSLTGGEDCTAFQFMLSLPEGASLTAVMGSEERLGDHELLFRRQADGRYLVLGFAMDNRCIGESSGELLSLHLEGNANGRATVSEALIFTPQAETRRMNVLEIDLPTAVSGIRVKGAADEGDIYDLGGRRLNKKPSSGYYIQGGKKYFVK